MKPRNLIFALPVATALTLASPAFAAKAKGKPAEADVSTSPEGQALKKKYADMQADLLKQITAQLPKASPQKVAALKEAQDAVANAKKQVDAADKNFSRISIGKGSVAHAKGKWIGDADKGIAAAQAALKNATTDAAREAAQKDLAKWQANREEGVKALAQRQADLDAALKDEPALRKVKEAADATMAKAKDAETKAAQALMAELGSVLASDKLDDKLVACTVLTAATPARLAQFGEKDPQKASQVDKLLANPSLMKDMLEAGGASFGNYGPAIEIYTNILKASPKAASGNLQRLALATALEHAKPIVQSAPKNQTGGPEFVDPVKRYLHYEKAFLDGELDPAVKNLTTWEYRHVVDCDAPDEILQWGRTMLRNYRPDHINTPDYGWRYVSTIRTEVPYGSQNVQFDDPNLHNYQNIIRNGGVCGRRAFMGRFILRSFGIPTWGVTQHAHAALSHWTPKGWVVNLGAGFPFSWWDKDEVPLSGTQFLLETQARAHGGEYLKVLRAQWISRILGEEAYNERKNVAGGFWSNTALFQAKLLAATASTLGPLGQELGEANEKEQSLKDAKVSQEDQKVSTRSDGTILIPAVASTNRSGKASTMNSYLGGMQIHALGGSSCTYEVQAQHPGKYQLTARVCTVQTGQKIAVSANGDATTEKDVPYTIGMWKSTEPVEVTIQQGKNTIKVDFKEGSRGVTIKDLELKPAK